MKQLLVLDADGDTTISADTDDQIDFKTGGTDRVVIASDGDVGIGTTSPDGSSFSASSSPVLDVSGTRPLIILSETDSNTKKAWLGLSSDQFFVGGTNTLRLSTKLCSLAIACAASSCDELQLICVNSDLSRLCTLWSLHAAICDLSE